MLWFNQYLLESKTAVNQRQAGSSHLSWCREHVSSVSAKQGYTFNVSDSIGLGQAEFEDYTDRGAELTLNGYNGTISVGPQMSANDTFRPLGGFAVPIPSNVATRTEGGISL